MPAKLKIEINTTEHFQVLPLRVEEFCANDDFNFTKDEFIENLELKCDHQAFQSDMHALLPTGLKWNFDEAYQFVVDNVISRLP